MDESRRPRHQIVTLPPYCQAREELEETFLRCLHLKDEKHFGAIYLQSHLTKLFPVPNWDWIARKITGDSFIIEPPDAEWRSLALSKGQIWLGDECFPIEPFDLHGHNARTCTYLVHVWVKIRGLPPHLWKDVDFERLSEEFEGFVMDVDPSSAELIESSFMRIEFGVRAREDIPQCRRMKFVDDDGKQMSYVLTFEIEDDPQLDVAFARANGVSSSEGNKSIAAWN